MATKSFELSQMANTLVVGADETTVQYGHSGTFTGDLTVEGNFTVNGDTITITSTELAVQDNMIFLNTPSAATITSASGDGSTQTYTADNNYAIGYTVVITGMSPAGYNTTSATITGATSTSFTIAGSEQGTYVSGGSASAKAIVNPDLGFVGEYNDGADKHAGLFRDATDGRFKFFDSYTPDPAGTINTAHASFALADVELGFLRIPSSGQTLLLGPTSYSDQYLRFRTQSDGVDFGLKTGVGANGSGVIKTGNLKGFGIAAGETNTAFGDLTDAEMDFFIKSGGNVGIGTTDVTEKFNVYGTNLKPVIGEKTAHTVLYTGYDGQNNTALEISASGTGTSVANLVLNNPNVSAGGSYHGVVFTSSGTSNSEKRMASIGANLESAGTTSLTGYLGFYTSSAGTLGERLRITSSGNVGIGTDNPSAKLTITDEDGGQPMLQVRNFATTATGAFSGSYTAEIRSATSGSQTHGMLIHHNEANDSRRTLDISDSNGVFTTFVNGKVGIGTDSPSRKLEIYDTTTSPADLSLYVRDNNVTNTSHNYVIGVSRQNSNVGALYLGNDSSSNAIIAANNSKLRIGKDVSNTFSEYMTIDTSGNVGIGTTTPGVPLHIYNTADGKMTLQVASGDSSEWNYLNFTGSDGVRDGYVGTNNVGDIQIYSDKNGNYLQSASTHWFTNEGFSVGTSNWINGLQVGASTFDGTNGVYANNRVGISNHGALTSIMYASTYNNATYPDYGLVFVHGPSTSSYNVWSISPDGPAKGDSLNFIYGANATNIHTATPKVVFDGNGHVGVGTASPTNKLHVYSTTATDGVLVQGNQTAGPALILESTAASGKKLALISNNTSNTDGAGRLQFWNFTDSHTFATWGTTSGSTSNLYTNLTVHGMSNDGILTIETGTTNSYDAILNLAAHGNAITSEGAQIWYDNSVGDVHFQTTYVNDAAAIRFHTRTGTDKVATGTNERLTINGNGNVGIGYTNPGYNLAVNGTAYVNTNLTVNDSAQFEGSTNPIRIGDGFGSGGSATIHKYNADLYLQYNNGQTATNLRFGGGGTSVTLIDSQNESWRIGTNGGNSWFNDDGGNVGIGVSTPQKTLDVVSPNNGHVTVGARTLGVGNYTGIHFGYRENNTSYRKSAIVFERTDNAGGGANAAGKIHILNGPETGAGSASYPTDAKVTIDEVGNVGIGITNPSAKFEVVGTAGGLFSVTDSLTGTIFGVADASGIPSIEVDDTGVVRFAEFQGNVLIGTATDDAQNKLQVDGGIMATADITAYASSDERLKTNLEPIDNALEKVNSLTGYTFNWNEHARGKDPNAREAGVIAQDVEKVLPEVTTTRDDGYMAVKYEKLVPLLIEAIKDLKAEIEELKRK